jgi:hypothetical protein
MKQSDESMLEVKQHVKQIMKQGIKQMVKCPVKHVGGNEKRPRPTCYIRGTS